MRRRTLVSGIGAVLVGLALGPAQARAAAEDEKSTTSASGATALKGLFGGSKTKEKAVQKEADKASPEIAHFHLSGALEELTQDDPFGFSAATNIGLRDMLKRLDKARRDSDVKALALTLGDFQMGMAQMEELRSALMKFREAKKPVLVHVAGQGPVLTLGRYAFLSAASEIILEPTSDLWLTGLYVEQPYLKDTLAKIGVEADFLQMGAFKSGAELLSRSEPTKEAHENMTWLIDSLYDTLIIMVSEGRGLPAEQVRTLVDGGPYKAEDALKLKLIDRIADRDEFLTDMKKRFADVTVNNRYGEKEKPKVDLNNPFGIFRLLLEMSEPPKKSGKDAVGIVHVDGMIVPGYAEPNPFFGNSGTAHGEEVRAALEKAADDDKVKAIVLRVDSPGGSALASEVILRAAKRAAAKKPLVVSMGNVAGSGGYYVAMAGETIFADASTITASIGVLSGKLITNGMWDKLGTNWVEYKRGKNSDLFSSAHGFTPEQRETMLRWMQDVYGTFLGHVRQARGAKLTKPLEELAEGRVYSGRQAKELGLIDEVGGLTEAVRAAAERAKLTADAYDVRVVPEPKNPLQELADELGGKGGRKTDLKLKESGAAESASLPARGGVHVGAAHAGAAGAGALFGVGATQSPLLQAAFPMLQALDPARYEAMTRMLQRVGLLQTEAVLMVTPSEWVIR